MFTASNPLGAEHLLDACEKEKAKGGHATKCPAHQQLELLMSESSAWELSRITFFPDKAAHSLNIWMETYKVTDEQCMDAAKKVSGRCTLCLRQRVNLMCGNGITYSDVFIQKNIKMDECPVETHGILTPKTTLPTHYSTFSPLFKLCLFTPPSFCQGLACQLPVPWWS
jgi:hypothetical protein